MLKRTNLIHPTTRAKILKASRDVLFKGYSVQHVRNKQGKAFLAIRYDLNTGKFIVFDRNYVDVTRLVSNSL